MSTARALVLLWAILSLPFAALVGKFIASGQREPPPIDKRSARRTYHLDEIYPESVPKAAGDSDDEPL